MDPGLYNVSFLYFLLKPHDSKFDFSADRMSLILWLTQSCLLSLAIFVLLGEELVLDHKHGDLLCTKVVRMIDENAQQYPNNSQCCRLEKSSKWQISFGFLATVTISLMLVVFGLRSHGNSAWPFLPTACVTCWLLNIILLLTKLIDYLTPEPETVAKGSYISTLLTFVWNALADVFAVGIQRIFSIVAQGTSRRGQPQDLGNGLYFCSPQLEKLMGEISGNLPCVVIVLIVAYFISSGYTLCLVLTHEEVEQNEEPSLKPNRSTRRRRSQQCGDHGNDSSDMGREGEGRGNKTTEGSHASRNCLPDLKTSKLSVAFVEESDDESFVFGWRL